MSMDLNFEAEAFAGYNPSQDEDSEQFEKGGKHGGSHHHRKSHGGRWRSRRHSRRWPWLRGTGFGSGGSTQDPQSVAWAQGCLSQITGNMVPQNGLMGSATRSAIRVFQMQQQLPRTGMLDDATMAALQDACADAGGQDDTDEISSRSGFAPPFGFQRQDSEVGGYKKTGAAMVSASTLIVWFEFNSTKLRQDDEVNSVVQLAFVIKASLQHLKAAGKAGKIILHGFASKEGAEASNQQLSVRRAQRVKDLLIEAGVPEDRIQIIGHGAINNWPQPGLKWNRRVEVEFQP